MKSRKVCWMLISLSCTAMSPVCRAAWNFASVPDAEMLQIGTGRRRLLNPSAHTNVAYPTASKLHHDPR